MVEKRLGRGLDFLISRTTTPPVTRPVAIPSPPAAAAPPAEAPAAPVVAAPPPPAPGPRKVSLDRIQPNPFQPRREFAAEALADLEQSIRSHGVLQPVVLREVGEGFQLVAGERRFRAARNVGLQEIPAVLREVTDEEMLVLALVENLQREDLNPMETARAYSRILETRAITHEELAGVMGKSRVSITNTLRLLDLPEDLQGHVSRGTLTAGHGRALLMAKDPEAMKALADRILAEGLSVREAEAIATGAAAAVPPALRPVRTPKERSSHLAELEDRLRTSLGTRVAIKPGRGKRGKILVYYSSIEDFDRIFEILTGPAEAPGAKIAAG